MTRTLIIGGTGPSGVEIVRGLVAAGDEVTVLHTGLHEAPLPESVIHIHADPRELESLTESLRNYEFDRAVSTSGRVRHVASVLAGRVDRLVTISGLPAYAAFSNDPDVNYPGPLPLREDDPRTSEEAPNRHSALASRGERTVMEAHERGDFEAVILRYTMIYGPYSYIPFEWYFVRRVLDGRVDLALEADGLTVPQRGYGPNVARGVILALNEPEAVGEIFNIGDERCLTVRGIAEEVAKALDHQWNVVSVPLTMTPCNNIFSLHKNTAFDMSKAQTLLGYRDVVPVDEATRLSALWLRDNQPERGGPEERSLGARAFDYANEDRVIQMMQDLVRTASRPPDQQG